MRFDIDTLKPDWSHTIELRDRVWPLLPPDRVDAADAIPARRGLVGKAQRAWRRVIVGVFGAPLSRELRDAVKRCFPAEARSFIEGLTVDELVYCQQVYLACQADHFQQVQTRAIEALTNASIQSPVASSSPPASSSSGVAMKFPVQAGVAPDVLRPYLATPTNNGDTR